MRPQHEKQDAKEAAESRDEVPQLPEHTPQQSAVLLCGMLHESPRENERPENVTPTEEQKQQLREVIHKTIPCVHCRGCEGFYDDGPQPGEDEKATEDTLNAVCSVIESWEQKS